MLTPLNGRRPSPTHSARKAKICVARCLAPGVYVCVDELLRTQDTESYQRLATHHSSLERSVLRDQSLNQRSGGTGVGSCLDYNSLTAE